MISAEEIIESIRLTRQLGADIYNPFNESYSPAYVRTNPNENKDAKTNARYVLRKTRSGEFMLESR